MPDGNDFLAAGLEGRTGSVGSPLSSELGTFTRVKARLWPWLEPFFRLFVLVVPSSLGSGDCRFRGGGGRRDSCST